MLCVENKKLWTYKKEKQQQTHSTVNFLIFILIAADLTRKTKTTPKKQVIEVASNSFQKKSSPKKQLLS